jgi:hypothetical protein
MKKIFLLITLSITSFFKNYGQTSNYLKLTKINWQESHLENSFIEKLFDRKQYDNIEIPNDKIKTVYDRYELTISIEGFYVNFLDYINGKPIIRYIINEKNKVEYWNYFHKNGNLKLKGYTIGPVQKVGIWEQYSELGELESVINYEEKRLSFNKVYQLVKNKNWLKNELELSFSKVSGHWIIKDWTKKLEYVIDSDEKISIEKFKENHLDEDMILH